MTNPITFPREGGAFTFAKPGCSVSCAPTASWRPRARSGEDGKRKERNADMAKQMTLDERKRIDFLLQLGWTPVQIAKEMGRDKTTFGRVVVLTQRGREARPQARGTRAATGF